MRRVRQMLPVLVWTLALFGLATPVGADDATAPGRVGYRVIDVANPAAPEQAPLTVAVWYPTGATPAAHTYGGPTQGLVAIDAAPCGPAGSQPLLVFSHGYGGSGVAQVYLAEALAARGWVVAAPDHHDRHVAVRIRTGAVADFDRSGFLQHAGEIAASTPADRPLYTYRCDELRRALDAVLADPVVGPGIDPAKIAVGGHSFGGFTALGLCGTLPERADPRIRALLILSSGAGGYLYEPEELARVTVPVAYFLGEKEQADVRGSRTMAEIAERVYGSLRGPKYFFEVKGASHFSFNNGFSNRAALLRLCGTEAEFAVIRRFAIAFLERHVCGLQAVDAALNQDDPGLTGRRCEPGHPAPAEVQPR